MHQEEAQQLLHQLGLLWRRALRTEVVPASHRSHVLSLLRAFRCRLHSLPTPHVGTYAFDCGEAIITDDNSQGAVCGDGEDAWMGTAAIEAKLASLGLICRSLRFICQQTEQGLKELNPKTARASHELLGLTLVLESSSHIFRTAASTSTLQCLASLRQAIRSMMSELFTLWRAVFQHGGFHSFQKTKIIDALQSLRDDIKFEIPGFDLSILENMPQKNAKEKMPSEGGVSKKRRTSKG